MNGVPNSLNPQAGPPPVSEVDFDALRSVPLAALTRMHYAGLPRRGHRRDASFWSCAFCLGGLAALQAMGIRVLRADGRVLQARVS